MSNLAHYANLFTPFQLLRMIPERARVYLYAWALSVALFTTIPLIQIVTEHFDQKNKNYTYTPVFVPPPKTWEPPEITPPKKLDAPEEPLEIDPPKFEEIPYIINHGLNPNSIRIPGYTVEHSNLTNIDYVLDLDEVDIIPEPIRQISPNYPPELRKYKIQGTVIVEFIVNEMGNVIEPMIRQSNNQAFSRSSMEAIRKWKFHPGEKSGKPVKVRMRLPFTFKLKS